MAVAVTACPAFPAKVLIPGPRRALKLAARTVGARVVGSFRYGGVARTPDSTLDEKSLPKAYRAGEALVSRIS